MSATIELDGGLDLLFPQRTLAMPLTTGMTIGAVAERLATLATRDGNLISPPTGGVGPGILVLVNDADFMCFDGPATVVEDGDHVVFISTVHGG
jgi:ubiquitin related modifier 1